MRLVFVWYFGEFSFIQLAINSHCCPVYTCIVLVLCASITAHLAVVFCYLFFFFP